MTRIKQESLGIVADWFRLTMTPAEAVEQATAHVIEAQLRIIERLTAENAELRKRLEVLL